MTSLPILLGAGGLVWLLARAGGRRQPTNVVVPQRVDEAKVPRGLRWMMRRQYREVHWLEAMPRVVLLVPLALLAGLVYAWMRYRSLTVVGLVLVLALVVLRRWSARAARRHQATVVRPLYAALARLLGLPEGDDPSKWLHVPVSAGEAAPRAALSTVADRLRLPRLATLIRLPELAAWLRLPQLRAAVSATRAAVRTAGAWVTRRPSGRSVVIRLPETWLAEDGDRSRLTALVNSRLAGEWEARWDTRHFRVTFNPAPQPPTKVTYAQVKDYIDGLSANLVYIGQGTRGGHIVHDLTAEAPHLAFGVGETGAGKSVWLYSIASQQRAKGDRVIILDFKRISLMALKGVPGIDYYTTARHATEVILALADEVEHRFECEEAGIPYDNRPIRLVIDEQNIGFQELQDYWDSIKPKDHKGKPPFRRALSIILLQGRVVNITVFSTFQRMEAAVAGGGALRAQYGGVAMNRFRPADWLLIIGTRPVPRSSRHPGRGVWCLGSDWQYCQYVYMTPEEARELALSGPAEWAEIDLPSVSVRPARVSLPGGQSMTVPGQDTPITVRSGQADIAAERDGNEVRGLHVVPDPAADVAADDAPEPIIGLAAGADFLNMSLSAFTRARTRREIPEEFRVGTQPAWLPEMLTDWRESAPRAAAQKG